MTAVRLARGGGVLLLVTVLPALLLVGCTARGAASGLGQGAVLAAVEGAIVPGRPWSRVLILDWPSLSTSRAWRGQDPAWRPRDEELAFVDYKDARSPRVFLASPSRVRELCRLPAGSFLQSWAADGASLYFWAYFGGRLGILEVSVDGTVTHKWWDPALDVVYLCPSPEGHTLAVGVQRDVVGGTGTGGAGGADICLLPIPLSSGPLQPWLANGELAFPCGWSPDASRVLYVCGTQRHFAVYTRARHGGRETALSAGSASSSWARWSPAGDRISLVTIEGNTPTAVEVYLVESAKRIHVAGASPLSPPSWAPGGHMLSWVEPRRDANPVLVLLDTDEEKPLPRVAGILPSGVVRVEWSPRAPPLRQPWAEGEPKASGEHPVPKTGVARQATRPR